MPVEIKELIVRTNVVENMEDNDHLRLGDLRQEDKRQIIDQCVKQVMRLLNKQIER